MENILIGGLLIAGGAILTATPAWPIGLLCCFAGGWLVSAGTAE